MLLNVVLVVQTFLLKQQNVGPVVQSSSDVRRLS
jgi:hypothetical protein